MTIDKNFAHDLSGFVGTHFVYTYENGWKYELYVRNENTCDYRIDKGLVGGRWVTNQKIHAVQFSPNVFKSIGTNQQEPVSVYSLI